MCILNTHCLRCKTLLKGEQTKYCSCLCQRKSMKGKVFVRGGVPWNKGKTWESDARLLANRYWKGKKRDPETQKNAHAAAKLYRGIKHFAWKADKASYSAIHHWMISNHKKSGVCEDCGNKYNKSGQTDWANLGKMDRLDRSDWKELCCSCHRNMDNRARKERNGNA